MIYDSESPYDPERSLDTFINRLEDWLQCPDPTTAAQLIEDARDTLMGMRFRLHAAIVDANQQFDRRQRVDARNEALQEQLIRAYQQIALLQVNTLFEDARKID